MKKKVSLICFLACAIMLLTALSIMFIKYNSQNNIIVESNLKEENKEYNTYSYITDDILKKSKNVGVMVELNQEYTPEYMLEKSDIVALVTIVSIDGASMDYSVFGRTFGKMLVNNVFWGDISEGSLVEYLKPGGTVTIEEYDKYDIPEAVEKRDYLYQQSGIVIDKENSYLTIKIEDDITIEQGKTYLAYLKYKEKYNKYEIVGLQNGLREVNIEQKSRVMSQDYNVNKLKIKNNNTGDWEALDNYIQENVIK